MKQLPTLTQLRRQHINRIVGLVLALAALAAVVFVVTVIYATQGIPQAFIALPCMGASFHGIWRTLLYFAAKIDIRYARMCALVRFMEGDYPMDVMGTRKRIRDRDLLEEWDGFEEWRIYKQQLNNGNESK